MSKRSYPLEIVDVTYDYNSIMSKGHHDFNEFAKVACKFLGPNYEIGDVTHEWWKVTPNGDEGCVITLVKEGVRGAYPATVCKYFNRSHK